MSLSAGRCRPPSSSLAGHMEIFCFEHTGVRPHPHPKIYQSTFVSFRKEGHHGVSSFTLRPFIDLVFISHLVPDMPPHPRPTCKQPVLCSEILQLPQCAFRSVHDYFVMDFSDTQTLNKEAHRLIGNTTHCVSLNAAQTQRTSFTTDKHSGPVSYRIAGPLHQIDSWAFKVA